MIQSGARVYFVVSNLYVEEGVVLSFVQGRYTVRVLGENTWHTGPCGIRLGESRLYTSFEQAKKALGSGRGRAAAGRCRDPRLFE